MNRYSSGSVELGHLTESRELHHLTARYVVSATSPVHDLALISDIEEIASVGPDTVILLSPSVALGGWMISSALRYAWERRACALIVPEQSLTDTVVELAKRLGMSIFTTDHDMTRLALEVAIQIGVARAGSIARIQALTGGISEASDLTTAVELLSRELDGARVRILSAGSVGIAAAGGATESRREPLTDGGKPVTVEVPLSRDPADADLMTAEVTVDTRPFAENALTAAVPAIRALLADARLRATRASFPLVAFAALTGSRAVSGIDQPMLESSEVLQWPVEGFYIAVCILVNDRERLGAAVHQVWTDGFPDVPLARFTDGFLAFVPVLDDQDQTAVIARMRDQLGRVRSLGLMVGVSPLRDGRAGAGESVRQAWLAARLAGSDDPVSGDLVEFDRMPSRLLGRLLPQDLAEQLATAAFPRLVADQAAGELIEAVVAYLAARGSISRAAATLGVHRNTIQARVRRAEELGVDLSEPANVLPAHMMLTALANARRGSRA